MRCPVEKASEAFAIRVVRVGEVRSVFPYAKAALEWAMKVEGDFASDRAAGRVAAEIICSGGT